MAKVTVDGISVEVENGETILHACEAAGKEIPRFCYHERLSIAGNCRMCLVEVEGAPKPIASCAMPVADGMVVNTASDMVRRAREGVMEFMLINHPLDCPICDQGGECDLQDQAMGYGHGTSRYNEAKRAVVSKNMGPLISTIMTRCIHCTRCVRFATEIAGVPDMGAVGRGENMEITTYLEQALASELSGNVVDLCPVGALTSRPYAFNARPWELEKTESVDAMDAVGAWIRIDARGNQVMRVLPRINDDVNEEWISDKTRHAHDGLLRQRLDRPYLRGKNRRLAATGWDEALSVAAEKLQAADAKSIGAIAGDQCDAESMFALLEMMRGLGSPNTDCRQDGSIIGGGGAARAEYVFNSGFAGIDEADFILLVGSNPRHEAAVINARIRRRWLDPERDIEIARIGAPVDLTYPVFELGDSASAIEHPKLAARMKEAARPMMIIGQGALNRPDSAAILAAAGELARKGGVIKDGWNGFNILHTAAARVGGLDMGFVPASGGKSTVAMLRAAREGKLQVLYLLGADECDVSGIKPGKTFVIYQGSHGDAGAQVADVVLPGAAWCEKDAIFVNSEGRAQHASRAVFPPGDAREDWAILRALSERIGAPLPWSNHDELRANLIAAHPALEPGAMMNPQITAKDFAPGTPGNISAAPLRYALDNFYMTCPISRNSQVMAECRAAFNANPKPREAAE